MTPAAIIEGVNTSHYKIGKSLVDSLKGVIKQEPLTTKSVTLPSKPPAEYPEAIRICRLRDLKSYKYALRKVLFLQIEKTEDGETFIAKAPILEVFGLGDTEKTAIRDFQLSLIEDYEILREEENKLGDHLQGHFNYLTTIIREIQCR